MCSSEEEAEEARGEEVGEASAEGEASSEGEAKSEGEASMVLGGGGMC
jgi:hypothetical protein